MEKILCYSCNKSKANLSLVKSALLGINLFLCESCKENKMEPRWAVLIAGRQNGPDYVKDFISKKRYSGNDISAAELLI
jgi:protein-arginine kinase activator protein McsA